jgi:prepilin-type N-terminal cleavage/methylation domain-containing protein
MSSMDTPLAPARIRPRPRHQSGLTLIELLVTVVIFSLVITVFSQAMFQVGQFERASARSAVGWQRQWDTGFGADDFFHGMTLPPEAVHPLATGSYRRFSGWWLEQADTAFGRPVPVTLAIRKLETSEQSTGADWGMFLVTQDRAEVLLARWDREVNFEFINTSGDVLSVWPSSTSTPQSVSFEALPRAVQVVDSARRILVHRWVFAGQTQPGLAQSSLGVPFGFGATQ